MSADNSNKTILFRDLSDNTKDRFLRACTKKKISMLTPLNGAFIWTNTQEGYEFWLGIQNRVWFTYSDFLLSRKIQKITMYAKR